VHAELGANSLPAAPHSIEDAALEAAVKRFRPVLMTTLVATLGLLPAAVSNGIGAQTQKPLAVVVIGGSLILALLTQLLHPPLLVVVHRWQERRRSQAARGQAGVMLADGAASESLG
jgi:cobalt-zinc-cadmium resistance protein CzcA